MQRLEQQTGEYDPDRTPDGASSVSFGKYCDDTQQAISGFPRIFKNRFTRFFNTFAVPNEKKTTLIPSIMFILPKSYSWNIMQRTTAKLSSAV